jgi:hypothetical protein
MLSLVNDAQHKKQLHFFATRLQRLSFKFGEANFHHKNAPL